MVTPLPNLSGLTPGAPSAAELYGRVSKTLLAQNPGVRKLGAALEREQTRLSSLGQLQSALANFQSLTASLAGPGLQTGAVASNGAVLSGLTSASAKAGSFAVEVKQLAQGQLLASKARASENAAIGDGGATTVRIEFGTQSGNSFRPGSASARTLTIDSSNNTLKGIAGALKGAGIEASVVRSGSGYSLQITGQSGSANSLKISVGGDADLQKLLAYNPSGVRNLSQTRAAQDALLSVDGKQITSASNVVTGAITGTALALTATGATQVTVGQDNAAIERNIGNLVSGFNSLQGKFDSLGQGDLRGQNALVQAREQLSRLIGNNGAALARAGVSLERNGELKIDSKTLKAAVSADPQGVAALFTDNGKGVADQLGAAIGELLGDRSTISRQKVTLDREIGALEQQRSKLGDALKAQAGLLVAQYAQASQAGETNTALPGLPGGGANSLLNFLG